MDTTTTLKNADQLTYTTEAEFVKAIADIRAAYVQLRDDTRTLAYLAGNCEDAQTMVNELRKFAVADLAQFVR